MHVRRNVRTYTRLYVHAAAREYSVYIYQRRWWMQSSVEQPCGNVSRSVIYGRTVKPAAASSSREDLKVRSGLPFSLSLPSLSLSLPLSLSLSLARSLALTLSCACTLRNSQKDLQKDHQSAVNYDARSVVYYETFGHFCQKRRNKKEITANLSSRAMRHSNMIFQLFMATR